MGHYDEYGPEWYDTYWAEKLDPWRAYHAWAMSRIDERWSVLDVGCGPGHLLAALANRRQKGIVVGIDFSGEAVKHCTREGLAACLGTAEHLPFGDKSFDVVTCLETLEHTEDPKAVLAECRRVARRSVIISVPPEMDIPQHSHGKLTVEAWRALLDLPDPTHVPDDFPNVCWEIMVEPHKFTT